MTTRELAERVMAERKLDVSDTTLRNCVVFKVLQALRHARRRKLVRMVETAYADGSGRESLQPDVEVEVRAGERVECSLYVPADGATT